MPARVLGGVARSLASFAHDLNFEACSNGVDPRITSSGAVGRTRVNASGLIELKAAPRIDHNPVGRTNTLKSSVNMSDAAYWLQNVGGWWTNAVSYDKPQPELGATVTKYTKVVASPPDAVFARCHSLSIPVGARSGSAYVWVPSGQGFSSYQFSCDWADVEQGTTASSTVFDQWVRLESTATLVAPRAFLDYRMSVNGSSSPPLNAVFYLAAPQESDVLSAWIPTGAAPVTVYDSKGLLGEPGRQFLLLQTADFGTTWTLGGATPASLTANTTVAPDGTTTADTITGRTDNSDRVQQTVTVAASTVYVLSHYCKNTSGTTQSKMHLSFPNSGVTNSQAYPNWTGSAVTSVTNDGSTQSSFALHADGFYRISMVVTSNASDAGTATARFYPASNQGATVKSLIEWGASLEVASAASPFATSYVPVTTAPVTVDADANFIQGAAFTQYFTSAGTYVIEFTPRALTHNEVYWGIGQTSVFNNSLYLVNSSMRLFLICYSAGVNTMALDLGAMTINVRHKVAISYQAGETAARLNGGAELLSSGALPAVIDIEGLLTSPWGGGSGGTCAHMHRRRHRPVPGRGDLYQLTA